MQELLTFIVASILITFSPGPDIIMVISYSLQKGFKSSIKFIMGLITGLLFHSFIGVKKLILDFFGIGEKLKTGSIISWFSIGIFIVFSFFIFVFIF